MLFSKKKIDKYDAVANDVLHGIAMNNAQARSEAAQEVISEKSGFVEKWMLFLLVVVLCGLFACSWFISYPDIVQARATLSTTNGPKEVITMQTGRLIRLFVTNGEQVKRNDKIAWIESTTNPEEALQLSAQLDSTVSFLIDGKIEKIPDLYKEHFKNLGNIQAAYQTYTTALQQFTDYYINGFYNRKKQMLLHNMTSISKMSNELDKQKNLELKDSQIADNTFKMYERLYKEKVISLSEYRQEESRLINNQKSIPQINSSILSNQNQQRDQLKDLEQLDHDIAQQKMTFEQSLQTLKSSIDEWKRQCIVTAPVDGTLVYALPVQQNQFVEQGKLLAYVNPGDNNSHMFVYLAQGNLGKIDTGMQVQLRFDAYPYQEAGFVIGHLNYISRISSDSGYLSTIRLDNGLQTNIKKNIEYKNGLKATALIITRDMRLLQRLYYDMIKSTSIGR